ncbi:1-(5-phosphoribosyl)-5-[(5-phosphoribosylamino)methylideneamino]imidazole-4-carboxamide isomerase [Stomatohabitans albus]|uniref:1-(5-phosphoribosyl)-5-[(5- phosphoribosylamino)methylideneamino]imidazole-4- carboxamide isomerase n=1 Tax=Stomatohabitans albus TaxID=3110766 RepID=UPI00300D2B78
MGLTLYPAVDIKEGQAVRLTQGKADEETVYNTSPVIAATAFANEGANWLHVVDLDAAFTGKPRNRPIIRDIIAETGVSVQASGGIRTLNDLNASIDYGAQQVVIGTMAIEDPDFIREALQLHGDSIVVGLDAEGRTLKARGWTSEGGDLFEALDTLSTMGVRRFVYTDISRDGMLNGPNLDMLAKVADATDSWITASGGVATLDDLVALRTVHPRVDAVIVGKALYSGSFTVAQAIEVLT